MLFFGPALGFIFSKLQVVLMFANALAILNEHRFLAPRGWTLQHIRPWETNSFKAKIIRLIHCVQYFRVPLILLNSVVIGWKLFLG